MKFNKKLVILAAAGALSAVTAIPAMALENEFHGTYTIKGFASNYQDGGAADVSPSKLGEKNKDNNYAEQRIRIFYTGKVNTDLKLVTGFELDTRFGGVTNGKYTNTSDAGVLDGDGINLETKWAYLDYNATKNVNIKTGLLPYKDSIKGLLIDADLTAIYATTKLDPLTLGFAYSRFSEANQTTDGLTAGHLGDFAKDLLIADATYVVTKDLKAGLSYYFMADYQTATKSRLLHTFALNGEAKFGPATVSGFAAMQTGKKDNTRIVGTTGDTKFQGYALNAAAKLAVGPGTAKTAILYVSGDDSKDNKNTAWQGSGVQSYNESGLMLLVRNNATSGQTSSGDYFRRTISNVGLYSLGYDANITPKVYTKANLGFAWAPEKGSVNDSYLGTEIALEGGYKATENLTASLQAAYVVLGDFFKNSSTAAGSVGKTPENPYTVRLVMSYVF